MVPESVERHAAGTLVAVVFAIYAIETYRIIVLRRDDDPLIVSAVFTTCAAFAVTWWLFGWAAASALASAISYSRTASTHTARMCNFR